jgi:hypothetical protein
MTVPFELAQYLFGSDKLYHVSGTTGEKRRVFLCPPFDNGVHVKEAYNQAREEGRKFVTLTQHDEVSVDTDGLYVKMSTEDCAGWQYENFVFINDRDTHIYFPQIFGGVK